MIRRPPRSTLSSSSAASDVYKRQSPVGWRADGAAPDRRRRPTSSLRPRHADRRRPRPRPGGPVLRLAGRRRRRGPAGAERDGAGHGVARGPTERPDGLAQGLRRAGFRLLHQLHLSQGPGARRQPPQRTAVPCLLYTSDAADEEDSVDLGGRRIIKKKKKK